MLAWRRRVTIGKFKAALKLVPHEMLKLAPHDESRNNRPGTRVDHHPSLTRRHHVTIQGARVREEIAPGILCAPHGRGAGAGGLPELLRDVGAVAVCAGRSPDIRRFRKFLDRRAARAGGARHGRLSEGPPLFKANGRASGPRLAISGILLSAVLPAAVRRLGAAGLSSRALPVAGGDLCLLHRDAAGAAAKGLA